MANRFGQQYQGRMGYWRDVSREACGAARKRLRVDTTGAIVILIASQSVVALILWFMTGDAGLPARFAATISPFLLLPIVYLLEFAIAPSRMHEAQRLRADEAETKFASLNTAPVPDWPIGDLFWHIDPNISDDDDSEPGRRWERVGLDVMDKLSTGRLIAWGRPERNSAPYRLIPADYWQKAQWTYWFIQRGGISDDLVHCHLIANLPNREQYRDVRVNKAQALNLWYR